VLVAPGIYYESLTMKPGVHIHGQPGAILDGSHTFGPVVRALSGVEATAVLSGVVIRRGRQSGIFLNQANPTIRNTVITEQAGAGIVCAQASPQLINNIITRNAGGGIVCQYPGTAPHIAYNNLWQNQPANLVDCPSEASNWEQEPEFMDAEHGDYRLQATSLLRNAGSPAVEFQDSDGSRSDLGIDGGPQPQAARTTPRRARQATPRIANSLSFQGLPGLIDIPTATSVPSGSLDVAYNQKPDPNLRLRGRRQVDDEQNFNFAVGLLPRVTIGGRGAVADNAELGRDILRDISANLHLLLLDEGAWWPAAAVGFQDLGGGAQNFESTYITLSKSFFGRVRGTVGYGTGPDTLEGPFAGLELSLNRFVTLLGEYDGDNVNAGLRLFPLPPQLEAYGIPRPTVDLIWQEGEGFSWGINLRSVLGEAKFQAQRAARADKRYHRLPPSAAVSLQDASTHLQALLIDDGLENVRVTMAVLPQGTTVIVEYENRRYGRNELDGLGVVMGVTATRVPPMVTQMRFILKHVNTPVLQVTTRVDDFLAFLNEEMSATSFTTSLQVTHQISPYPDEILATTSTAHRSWLKPDVFLRPGLETQILTEIGIGDVRFSLFPDAFVQLTPGTVINVEGNIPITETEGFRAALGEPRLERVLLHQAWRLPVPAWLPGTGGITQFSVGQFFFSREPSRRFPRRVFNTRQVGFANETVFTLLDGWLYFESNLARIGSSFGDLDCWVALGNVRGRYPALDLTLSLTGGLFLDGDHGIAVTLTRLFGNTRIGVFLRHTEHGSLGGLTMTFPLTLSKELKPFWFRPRLPNDFTYLQSTTVFTERNILRGDIGRSLGTGHGIEAVYWDRARLNAAYIQQHLDILKQAVRRWVDDAATTYTQEGK
jgi:hypothetical protein